jgi:hypothetical protein
MAFSSRTALVNKEKNDDGCILESEHQKKYVEPKSFSFFTLSLQILTVSSLKAVYSQIGRNQISYV